MNTTRMSENTLDDLATATVRLGRELHDAAHAISLGGNSRDFGFVGRSLQHLAERDPFDPRYEASLQAVRGILTAELQAEVQGIEQRFVETHYDAAGQQGEVRDCPIYSLRGEALLSLQKTFERFLTVRDQALDRVAAERALVRLLAR